jgi:Family of unknown function (DUF6186)
MSSRVLTILGYGACIAAGVVLQLLGRREGSRIPTFGRAVSRAMHTRSGRVGIMAGWAWVGLHFFAR